MCCRCFCTVRELMPRISPISLSVFPAAREQVAVERGQRLAHQVQEHPFALAEIALAAVQHEAHEQAAIDHQRDGHRVVNPDLAVVLVIERAFAELTLREQVADPPRSAAEMVGVIAHQRMHVEELIEHGALAR